MQKWEYCLVLSHLEGSYVEKTVVVDKPPATVFRSEQTRSLVLTGSEVPAPRLRVLAINGKPPKEELLSMYALASELGERGWELVQMEHTTAAGGWIVSVWVFKRPKTANRL